MIGLERGVMPMGKIQVTCHVGLGSKSRYVFVDSLVEMHNLLRTSPVRPGCPWEQRGSSVGTEWESHDLSPILALRP